MSVHARLDAAAQSPPLQICGERGESGDLVLLKSETSSVRDLLVVFLHPTLHICSPRMPFQSPLCMLGALVDAVGSIPPWTDRCILHRSAISRRAPAAAGHSFPHRPSVDPSQPNLSAPRLTQSFNFGCRLWLAPQIGHDGDAPPVAWHLVQVVVQSARRKTSSFSFYFSSQPEPLVRAAANKHRCTKPVVCTFRCVLRQARFVECMQRCSWVHDDDGCDGVGQNGPWLSHEEASARGWLFRCNEVVPLWAYSLLNQNAFWCRWVVFKR